MLLVAAGGGGDAITASVLASALDITSPIVVLTYSWDRLLIDPLPGPRSADDFTGLRTLGPHVHQILPTTEPVRPAGSALPRLAGELPAQLLLLDPIDGVTGMAEQIRAAAAHFGLERIGLVDVGGDVLAHGHEPNLRSPLADMLALAACTATGLRCDVIVLGPGIDGELEATTVRDHLQGLHAGPPRLLDSDTFGAVRQVFTWHPSEATGLLAAASRGARGIVETRDAGSRIRLTDSTPSIYTVDAYEVLKDSPAAHLTATTTFDDAAGLITEATGIDEIAYEKAKASTRRKALFEPEALEREAAAAASRGADYVTARRLAELVGATDRTSLMTFQTLLADDPAGRYDPPLYNVRQANRDPRPARLPPPSRR